MKRVIIFVTIMAISSLGVLSGALAEDSPINPCINCHDTVTPGIVRQWQESKHSKVGVKCYVCHRAKANDPAGFEHNGFRVTAIVTPKYCESCHAKEVKEFRESLHNVAGFFPLSSYAIAKGEKVENNITLGQNKNYKTNYSRESAEAGCLHCHGTVIKVGKDGELINWPNNGMGRLNPDGSTGTCSACHTRHTFSLAEARKPEACGQCHLGPDHPQIEIYEESKHAAIYATEGDKWNWDVPAGQWGPEDIKAPTCATCHMSGFGGVVETTHNVSARLKWELEPPYSYPTAKKYLKGRAKFNIDPYIGKRYEEMYDLPAGSLRSVKTGGPNPFAIAKKFAPEVYKKYIGPGKWIKKGDTRYDAIRGEARRSPEEKREDMLKVCTQCHSSSWAEGELSKADKVIDVYNALALAIKKRYYDPIKKERLDKDIKFNGKSIVDNLWHEIWHHEGRRMRMGAFMQGPDYEHWHGAYELSVDGSEMANWLDTLRTRKAIKEKLNIKK